MPSFVHQGVELAYRESGGGLPFVFQHGLGGDLGQPFGLFPPPPGVRLIGFEARGHGASALGEPAQISLATSAADLIALLDHLGIERAVFGGISMGAAIALRAALAHPARVVALVQSRPAWAEGPNPVVVEQFGAIARLVRAHGAEGGRAACVASPEFASLRSEAPDAATSLLNQFANPRLSDLLPSFERIPSDRPSDGLAPLASLRVPALVLGNRVDPIHPWAFAQQVARALPGAWLAEIPSKSVDAPGHAAAAQRHLASFLHPLVINHA